MFERIRHVCAAKLADARAKKQGPDRALVSPQLVFDEALAEKTARYEELKSAVAGVLYMRNKLEGDIRERRADIARVHHELRNMVRAGDERSALELISQKQSLHEELERAERELDDVRREARDAKDHLARVQEEIRSLEREKLRAIATLSNAKARVRVETALQNINTGEAESRASELERVREYLAKINMERSLDRELAGDRLDVASLASCSETALAELRALKTELATGRRLGLASSNAK